jgi:uncharacterized membrane protein
MYLIYLFLTICLIVTNLAGLTAWVSRFLPAQASARLLGVLVLTLSLFAVEHMHGLGKLAWLWPFSTAAALWGIWRYQNKRFWLGEAVFVSGFLYGLIWRYGFPNIDAGSEHITNLYFISNFYDGDTLPAKDRWLAGYVFDFYYAFQHYAAALLGRIFNLPIGLAMNLAWALIMGFLVSLGWEISSYFIRRSVYKVLLVAALVMGGNGLSPLVPWMIDSGDQAPDPVARVWTSTRFLGAYDENVNTAFGRAVAGNPKLPGFTDQPELPLETIAYYSVLGDYHPPLGGFVIALWTLALSAFLGVRRSTDTGQTEDTRLADRLAFFGIGMTPALVLISNAWVFPLQCLLLASWLLMRYLKADIQWLSLLIGGAASLALIYPFLSYFGLNAISTPIKAVGDSLHSPANFLLAMHWPLLVWVLSALWLAKKSPWAVSVAVSVVAVFVLAEAVYVDDPLGGKYERFNTTLKWWSWLWPVALISLGSVAVGLGGRVCKTVSVLTLLALLAYSVDLGRYWLASDKAQKGLLSGDGWLKQDDTTKAMLDYLSNAPAGNALESLEQGAYSNATALSLFAGKPLVLGWPAHEAQWRAGASYIGKRADEIRAFYKGESEDPLELLNKYRVQTVVWKSEDEQRAPNARETLQEQIGQDYYWRQFSQDAGKIAGFWERRPSLAGSGIR